MNWPKVDISINGNTLPAIAPLIISASRSTDIPAFYAKEFFNCLKKGHFFWTNPFNGKKSLISFEKTKFIVFWTKNAGPIIPYLEQINQMGINFYFNYTLNNYENEKLEIKLPSLNTRIELFKGLSEKIGREKVIWRFDPLILLKGQKDEILIDKIVNIASQIYNYTNKLVISFVDTSYQKVKNSLKRNGFHLENFNKDDKIRFIKKLYLAIKPFELKIFTCAEQDELDLKFVLKNKCVDDELIEKLSIHKELLDFINDLRVQNKLKDKGQRKNCGCMVSKDIGRYDSCFYGCTYCYAVRSIESGTRINIFE
jgi:DNA repair photolyase